MYAIIRILLRETRTCNKTFKWYIIEILIVIKIKIKN